jgi:hypothetical protein
MGKRKTNKRRTGKRGRKGRGGQMGRVPPFTPTMKFSHKFRFVNGSNNGTFTINRAGLLNLISYADSTTTTVRLFEAMRLKSVEVWSNPTALGSAPVAISLEWLGGYGPSTVVSDETMGVQPAHFRTTPPPSSSDRWWCMNGFNETDDLFTLILAANCVIDVVCECRVVEQEAPTPGDGGSGLTNGQLYGDYLDGFTSGKLAPVGYTVIL